MYRIIKRRSRRSVKCLESAATAAATAVITAAVVAAGEEKDENDYDPDDVVIVENIAKAVVVHSNLRFSVGDAGLRVIRSPVERLALYLYTMNSVIFCYSFSSFKCAVSTKARAASSLSVGMSFDAPQERQKTFTWSSEMATP